MTPEELLRAKRAVRQAVGDRRRTQSRWVARWRSRRLADRLIRLSAFRRARLLLAYAPIRGEADPGPALETARRAGVLVALPRVTGPRRLDFHVVRDAGRLQPGAFGIPEPVADPGTRIDPARADLILVPGVAFSLTGERLGFGGGFYDALLHTRRAPAVGLGFDLQVVASVPSGAHDARLDALVTERHVRFFGP